MGNLKKNFKQKLFYDLFIHFYLKNAFYLEREEIHLTTK